MARSVRAAMPVVGKFLAMQVTGGSSSMPDGYDKMRAAGAAARLALIAAAARQSGVAAAELKTGNGAVLLPDGSAIPYTHLAASVSEADLPGEVTLKPRRDWRLLGKPFGRADMLAKSTGTETYGIDIRLPDMVHATVRANPRLGGAINSHDASRAEKLPGVLKIVPLAGAVGVIADNTWRAFQAAQAIVFDWGAAPYHATSEAMWVEIAASFTEARQDSRLRDDGDVEAALAGGEVVTAEYRAPWLAHAPLEPMTATALLAGGRLEIWAATQVPLFALDAAAEITGLPREAMTLQVLPMGGSFGRRLELDFLRQAVELGRAMPGRPVKLTWTREEDMTHDNYRPPAMARGRGRVETGKVTAMDLAVASPSVIRSQMGRVGISIPGPDSAIVAGAWDQPYAIADYRVTGHAVPEMAPVSSWRSVGASINGFFHDCFLDELIHAAGADPMAERIRLCAHEPSRRVLEAVAEMSRWGAVLSPGVGRGVGFCLSFGVPSAQVVEVRASEAGIRITRVWAAVDVGVAIDPQNIEAQVQSGVIWGLGHAMRGEITWADGMVEQDNYPAFEPMRLFETPEISVRVLENLPAIRGVGEPAVPPAAPALANAIFAATGQRIREMPLARHVTFV